MHKPSEPASNAQLPIAIWLMRLGFLVLGLAVFCWGTSYKLSLYRSDQSAQTPVKLSTRGGDLAQEAVSNAIERPAVDELFHPSEYGFSLLDIAFDASPSFIEWQAPLPAAVDLPIQLTFRPPPASLCADV